LPQHRPVTPGVVPRERLVWRREPSRNSDSSIFSSTVTPASRSCASTASRSRTRTLIMKGARLGSKRGKLPHRDSTDGSAGRKRRVAPRFSLARALLCTSSDTPHGRRRKEVRMPIPTQPHRERGLTGALRQLALYEFELIEACHDASENSDGERRALLLQQAGTAQAHLFDVDSTLRERGEEPVQYASCMRHAMLSVRSLEQIARLRARAYARLLARPDLSPSLRWMLQRNATEAPDLAANAFAAAA
jgi:hypothetical protein